MTTAEKQSLTYLMRELKSIGYTKDQIYERIKLSLKPLSPDLYQKRIQFITKELEI